MYSFFLDASALAKRYANEAGSGVMNHHFANVLPVRFMLFNIGMAEVASLLVRKRNSAHLSAPAFSQAMVELHREIITSADVQMLVAGNSQVAAALQLIEDHSLNSTDAVILRLALDKRAALRTIKDDLVLVTSDQRLLRAAQLEGLAVFNPETQSEADLDALLGS